MAFYTLSQWRTTLAAELPNGANLAVTVMNEGIRNAVAYCGTWLRDIKRVDFVGDGVTQRFLLPGVDCALVAADQQETPSDLNTAGVLPPTTPAPPTASGSGSTFLAGMHYGAYSFGTILGETPMIVPYSALVVAAGQNVVFPVIAMLANVTTIFYYLSPGPMNADVRQAGSSTTGGTKTFTAPPPTTAARPFANYVPVFSTYAPIRNLEQDINVDGTPLVGSATLTLTTPPALGDRFRVVYECAPAIPQADSDIIRLPEQVFREAAVAMTAKAFAYLHESGDTTAWGSLFERSDAFLMDMQRKDVPRLRPRPRIVEET